MEESINVNEIAKIEQMPQIIVQVKEIGKYIDEALKGIDDLECNEENKKEVKEKRSQINKFATSLENKRKEIKAQILAPYQEFEEIYNNECKNKLNDASEMLGSKINEIEEKQKEEKENTLRDFFNQYQETYHLKDIVSFEDVGLNITLSASEKSLKDQIVVFCERINKDIQVINNEENKEELMLEYMKNGYDYQQAKLTLYERKKQIEELKAKQEEIKEQVKQEEIVEATIDEIGVPQELMQEEQYEATFTIKATKKQLQELKQWLEERNIEYD